MNKTLSRSLILIGVVLIAAGVIISQIIVPDLKVFPDDVDVVRHYNVEYLTLLDAESLQFIEVPPEEATDLMIDRHVKVEDVEGKLALVSEDQMLHKGEDSIERVLYHYPIHRQSLESVDNYPEDWNGNEGQWPREHLVIGWGPEVEKKDYLGWNDDTRDLATLTFIEETEHAGITTYHFRAETEPERIHDKQIEFLGLPKELSIERLEQLAQSLDIEDEELKQTVETFLPLLVNNAVHDAHDIPLSEEIMVPLVYYYEYVGDYWVEPETGVLINTRKYEHRTVTFPDDVMESLRENIESMGMDSSQLSELLPLTVNEFEYEATPTSIEDAKEDAQNAISRLTLFGTTIPAVLVALGIVAGGGGAVGLIKGDEIDRLPSQ